MTRTLVIDDEPCIRTVLRAILTCAGHEVFVAGDGLEALRLLEGQTVELVFCDMNMPGMDGLETIRLLRQLLPTVRIVAMSGGRSFGQDHLDDTLMQGATVTLDKPFTIQQALAAVGAALQAE
jgi:CheY-like chemotaxis protein